MNWESITPLTGLLSYGLSPELSSQLVGAGRSVCDRFEKFAVALVIGEKDSPENFKLAALFALATKDKPERKDANTRFDSEDTVAHSSR